MAEQITIQAKSYDAEYIEQLIDDMLDAEDRASTPDNRLDALNMLHNTTYLPDIDAELAESS